MQAQDQFKYTVGTQNETQALAKSLLSTLPHELNILTLHGEVGAGKTTFTQGLAQGLEINEPIVSPTYSLAQTYNYSTTKIPDGTLTHIDMYRLNETAANVFIAEHEFENGIACIEWPERSSEISDETIKIVIDPIDEHTRSIQIIFDDQNLIGESAILAWQNELQLPIELQQHCRLVAAVSHYIATLLLEAGIPVRRQALYEAALVHDLYRFVDFKIGKRPPNVSPTTEVQTTIWTTVAKQYPNLSHEQLVATILRKKNYHTIAKIVETHGGNPLLTMHMIEQKILYYADKRAMQSTLVSVDQRLADFMERYQHLDITSLKEKTQHIEQVLGIPKLAPNITSEMVAAHVEQHQLLPLNPRP